MPLTKELLLAEAMTLAPEEREALAEELMMSVESNLDIDAAWLEECKRRMEAADRGELATSPAEDVIRRLRERL